jgi:hypothetical protein
VLFCRLVILSDHWKFVKKSFKPLPVHAWMNALHGIKSLRPMNWAEAACIVLVPLVMVAIQRYYSNFFLEEQDTLGMLFLYL